MKKIRYNIIGGMNKTLIYKNITDFSKGLVRVGDIENDGTPLVVCYYRPVSQQYILSLWVDCVNNHDKWIFVSVKSSDIIAYLNKDIPMHRIVVDERPSMVLSFSINNHVKNNISVLKQFPEDCSTDYYYDSNYCKEEGIIRQFIVNNP
jgi:hypothetical protein